jgi:hypothetical protein
VPADNSIDKAKSYHCEEDCRLSNQEFYSCDIGFKLADIPLKFFFSLILKNIT